MQQTSAFGFKVVGRIDNLELSGRVSSTSPHSHSLVCPCFAQEWLIKAVTWIIMCLHPCWHPRQAASVHVQLQEWEKKMYADKHKIGSINECFFGRKEAKMFTLFCLFGFFFTVRQINLWSMLLPSRFEVPSTFNPLIRLPEQTGSCAHIVHGWFLFANKVGISSRNCWATLPIRTLHVRYGRPTHGNFRCSHKHPERATAFISLLRTINVVSSTITFAVAVFFLLMQQHAWFHQHCSRGTDRRLQIKTLQ